MLVFLQGWSRNKGIQLKLVDPSNFAREMFQRTGLTCVLHISSVGDAVDVLCESDGRSENVTKRRQLGLLPPIARLCQSGTNISDLLHFRPNQVCQRNHG